MVSSVDDSPFGKNSRKVATHLSLRGNKHPHAISLANTRRHCKKFRRKCIEEFPKWEEVVFEKTDVLGEFHVLLRKAVLRHSKSHMPSLRRHESAPGLAR